MGKIDKAKKALMSLVGIHYTVDDPEFIPIMFGDDRLMQDKTLGELVQELSKYLSNKKEIYNTYTEIRQTNHLVVSLLNKVAIDILYKGRDRKDARCMVIIYREGNGAFQEPQECWGDRKPRWHRSCGESGVRRYHGALHQSK